MSTLLWKTFIYNQYLMGPPLLSIVVCNLCNNEATRFAQLLACLSIRHYAFFHVSVLVVNVLFVSIYLLSTWSEYFLFPCLIILTSYIPYFQSFSYLQLRSAMLYTQGRTIHFPFIWFKKKNGPFRQLLPKNSYFMEHTPKISTTILGVRSRQFIPIHVLTVIYPTSPNNLHFFFRLFMLQTH